jgi:methionine synthase II (cobalamin-independent)
MENDEIVENIDSVENTKIVESLDSERSRILDEIAGSDYKIIKAVRLGKMAEELYPGITDWYNAKIERLREIEASYQNESKSEGEELETQDPV